MKVTWCPSSFRAAVCTTTRLEPPSTRVASDALHDFASHLGRNLNGKRFISTQDAAALITGLAISEPFTFTVGSNSVIPGLSMAVVGMRKDGYRRVVVPQTLGYDAAMTLSPVPDSFEERRSLASIVKNPNRDASLLFDVKLERIKSQR